MVLFPAGVVKLLRQAHYKNTTPVVKIFNPVSAHTWLLTHMEPPVAGERTVCWGYCDVGMGCVEYGTVYKEELEEIRIGKFFRLERDLYWKPVAGMDYSEITGRKSIWDGPF